MTTIATALLSIVELPYAYDALEPYISAETLHNPFGDGSFAGTGTAGDTDGQYLTHSEQPPFILSYQRFYHTLQEDAIRVCAVEKDGCL